jgi:hypothetical protein
MVLPPFERVVDPRTVNVDVVGPHGVTFGDPVTTNLASPATTSVRSRSIRRTDRHENDTRRPRYVGQEFARVLGATPTADGQSGAAGSIGGGGVVASGGSSGALKTGGAAVDTTVQCEVDGEPTESQAPTTRSIGRRTTAWTTVKDLVIATVSALAPSGPTPISE